MIKTWMMAPSLASFIEATGGTITYDGDYTIHTFTSGGAFEVTKLSDDALVECLVVAGGGGGGGQMGGGGGAGGLVYNAEFEVFIQEYTITVGGGGAGTYSNTGTGIKGSNSVFSTITAEGGRGGGYHSCIGGANGGSGGGGGGCTTTCLGGTGS